MIQSFAKEQHSFPVIAVILIVMILLAGQGIWRDHCDHDDDDDDRDDRDDHDDDHDDRDDLVSVTGEMA